MTAEIEHEYEVDIAPRFDKWLRHELWAREGCYKMVLSHLPLNTQKGHVVIEIPIPEKGTFEQKEIGDDRQVLNYVALELLQGADADASAIRGTQAYMVQSFHTGSTGKRKTAPSSRFTFRVQGFQHSDDSFESEPKNMQGLLAQLMRHNEANNRALNQNMGTFVRLMTDQNSKQSRMIDKFMDERMHMADLYETVRSQQHERDMQIREVDHKEKLMEDGLDTIKQIGPAILNKVVGKKLLPEPSTPERLALKSFAESLTEEQIEAMGGILSPAQTIAMGTILEMKNE